MQLVTATSPHENRGKIPRSCGPPPLPKGAIGGFVGVALITAPHFHAPCCTDWYMNYFARDIPRLGCGFAALGRS
jgi:hypothetical protein